MKMNNKKSYFTLFLCTAALIISVNIGLTSAYFTAHTTVEGRRTVNLVNTRVIPYEEVKNFEKDIKVENVGESVCWARVRVVAGDLVDLQYTPGAGWVQGTGGYWYYSYPIKPGQMTETSLKAKIEIDKESFEEDFNVIVLTECIPVLDKDGNVFEQDWSTASQKWIKRMGE